MLSAHFYKTLLCSLIMLSLGLAYANPMPEAKSPADDPLKKSSSEVSDLNVPQKNAILGAENSNVEFNIQTHNDADKSPVTDLELVSNLKYDVEILEPDNIKKENVEIEERFHGPGALKIDTDTFAAQNIEVNGGESGEDDTVQTAALMAHESQRLTLTFILVLVALVSIVLYASLVIWRSHLEQRYGMRELLVTSDDDFDPNSDFVGRSTPIAGGNNTSRHFTRRLGQP